MKILLLHVPSTMPTATPKQVAVNVDEILRMEEVEGGTTQIIQQDKGPTTVEENLQDILKAMGGEVKEVKSEKQQPGQQQPQAGQQQQPGHQAGQQPIGQAHAKAGGR